MPLEWVGHAGISSTGTGISISATNGSPSPGDYRFVTMFGSASAPAPSGWTLHHQENYSGSANKAHLYGRRFQSGDGTTTFSWSSNIYYNLTVFTVRGDDPDNLFAATPVLNVGGVSQPSWAAPALSPSVPGSMRIDVQSTLYNPGQASSSVTAPAQMTERGFWKHATNDIGYPVLLASESDYSSGTRTFSASPTPNGWYSFAFAVAPVPTAAPPTADFFPFFT